MSVSLAVPEKMTRCEDKTLHTFLSMPRFLDPMPIRYVRSLTARTRAAHANYHLGVALAFVAGATNAGGFLAVHQYTSHMTGIVSAMADNSVLGSYKLVLAGLGALLSFVSGASASAMLVNYSRRRRWHSEYAVPLLLEAVMLICFGCVGSRLAKVEGLFVPLTVMLLCFIMGLQNAVITKISNAEIRTTHITGTVTDIGIELGKLFYWNFDKSETLPRVTANRPHLRILTFIALSFFVGGVSGALGFKHIGYLATLPLAAILVVLAAVPAIDDFRTFLGGTRSVHPLAK